MQVKAKAKYIRMSPRKVRLVVDVVRGMDVSAALVQLDFVKKAASKPVKKVVASALANAVNNFKLDEKNLFIESITADDGPTLKRWRPRAFGRATTIRKRSTHIGVILAEKVPTDDKKKAKDDKKVKKGEKELEILTEKPKEEIDKSDDGDAGEGTGQKGDKSFKEKIFSRKSGM